MGSEAKLARVKWARVGGITYRLDILEELIVRNRCWNIPGHQDCKEVREQLWAEKHIYPPKKSKGVQG